MGSPDPVRLSKSKFTAGVQCLKRLYLQIHQPELAEEAGDEQEARLEQGQAVGRLAQEAFPHGALVDSDPLELEAALRRTAALVADPFVPAIFEATFQYSNVLVRVDILERRSRNRWRLIEVKSSVELKDHYLYDVAVQNYVVSGSGLAVSSAAVMHLNRDYIYDGKSYDPHGLFTLEDVTRAVRELGNDVPKLLRKQRTVLAQDKAPTVAPGSQCADPFICEFFEHCNPDLPENHISCLPRLSEKKKGELADLGVDLIRDIPMDFPLTEMQSRVTEAVRTGRAWTSPMLAQGLRELKYPMYFMDFESLYPAIPRYAGMWPYSHIPFQWSVHRQLAPDAPLEHFQFLSEDAADPRREFIDSLCGVLGRHGPIIVYNATFESERLRNLAGWLPEYGNRIAKIQGRLWDLLPFIRENIYHPEFQGSYSLKAVLPALVPDLSYDHLDVSDGGEAGLVWERMVRGGIDAPERHRLKSALLAYCGQDSFAMVKLLERLSGLASRTRVRGGAA
jgi:predicted RecB family nuclease